MWAAIGRTSLLTALTISPRCRWTYYDTWPDVWANWSSPSPATRRRCARTDPASLRPHAPPPGNRFGDHGRTLARARDARSACARVDTPGSNAVHRRCRTMPHRGCRHTHRRTRPRDRSARGVAVAQGASFVSTCA